ncbi:MAG: hypothetical protein DLM67_21115 [Candidatus Nephthysia bennettiae]|uniref:DUF4158 domain-containing protein n=1 Tax=Candidatus Nephthysia bennettiae TaxID=3127016 RepID=A0A934KBI7_9BACT|nr:DUF4158 domain-containing protein [Candidatus Dormibacteraeota bacterium]PZR88080.1 MAG: hypothetical protein DLM67_21115 [Candidatus Dormibacteraeota bacterium]
MVPDDLTLLDSVRGDGHRRALALQLVWACTVRVLDADPASLPSAVIQAVADQLALEPEILTSYRSWSATRAADSAVIGQHLGVRPFTSAAVIANQLNAGQRDQFDDLCRTEGKVSRWQSSTTHPSCPPGVLLRSNVNGWS